QKVLYVYSKQLEEAEAIVINKIDLLTAEKRERLKSALQQRFPKAMIFEISARVGTGLDSWFGWLATAELGIATPPEVDYEVYAEGEALLGWLNATLQASALEPFDGNAALSRLAERIQNRLKSDGVEIAHLKMTLTPDEEGGDIAVLNLVR